MANRKLTDYIPVNGCKRITTYMAGVIRENWRGCVLFLLMCVNLLYMHNVVLTDDMQDTDRYIRKPFAFACFDVLLTLLFFSLLTWRRKKLTYILSYAFLVFFVLSNVIYSRFFHTYFSPGVFSEISNFKGTWWFGYVQDAFKWTDLLLVFTTALFALCLRNKVWRMAHMNVMSLLILLLMICVGQIWYDVKDGYVKDFVSCYDRYLGSYFQNEYRYNSEPSVVSCGIIRTQVVCDILIGTGHKALDDAEKKEIDLYLAKMKKERGAQYAGTTVAGCPNIVFIIVESYLSVVSDLKVNGKEVTPYLNAIKHQGAYYNGRVTPCITTGESSDAQVMYFAGMIPLSKDMAIMSVIRDDIIGLPRLLHEQKGYSTYMTIPTTLSFWHQEEANMKYGIDTTYSTMQYGGDTWANDSIIFSVALDRQKQMKEPFFHAILTLSMHATYKEDRFPELEELVFPDHYSTEYKNYLKCCHYTDMQIGRYIEEMKTKGKYDNTVFIIASDHEAHVECLCTPVEELNDLKIPIYIINAGIDTYKAYAGDILQIDLYPSLMDLFGIKSDFSGMGHSIFRQNYKCELTDEARNISGRILTGNYFGQKMRSADK